MRIWQAGNKRNALRIGWNPLEYANFIKIGDRFELVKEYETINLYSGRAVLGSGAIIKYFWDSRGNMVVA